MSLNSLTKQTIFLHESVYFFLISWFVDFWRKKKRGKRRRLKDSLMFEDQSYVIHVHFVSNLSGALNIVCREWVCSDVIVLNLSWYLYLMGSSPNKKWTREQDIFWSVTSTWLMKFWQSFVRLWEKIEVKKVLWLCNNMRWVCALLMVFFL